METDDPKHDAANDNSRYAKIEALRTKGFVPYKRITKIAKSIRRIMLFGNAGASAGSPARCMLVIGPSGCGKSALMNQVASKFQARRENDRRICPVVVVEVPSNCKIGFLAEKIMLALGVPEALATRGTAASKTERVKHYLREQGVKLVILDEFQHMLKSDNQKVIFEAADYVKSLLNEGICSFVLVGTEAAKKVYESNEQLQRRSFGVHEIRPFDWFDADDKDTFVHILAKHQKFFPVKLEVPLYAEKVAYRIHCISKGNLGRAIDYVYALAVRAVDDGLEEVTVPLMREVAEDFRDFADRTWRNPFDLADRQLPAPDDTPEPSRTTSLGRRKRQFSADDLAA